MNKMLVLLAGFISILGSCTSVPSNEPVSRMPNAYAENPNSYIGGYDYDSHFSHDPADSLECDEFFNLLKSARPAPASIKDALEIVARHKPNYFKHYALAPASQSLHGSSWQFPRAIVHGGNSHVVLTFNGEPSQRAYERLETMCFREKTKTFEFREITFPQEAREALDDLTPAQKRQPFVISQVNGSKGRDCRQCHQSPSRPNWDAYARWPSVYGAVDDILFKSGKSSGGFSPYDIDAPENQKEWGIRYTRRERDAFKTFRRVGRYAVLKDNAVIAPNLRFGKQLGVLNAQRIVAELGRLGPRFDQIKADVAAALYCPMTAHYEMKSFTDQSGKGVSYRVFRPPMAKDVLLAASEAAGYHRSIAYRLRENFGVFPENEDYAALQAMETAYMKNLGFSDEDAPFVGSDPSAILRLVRLQKLLQPLGIEVRNWSMILHGGWDHEDGSTGDKGDSFVQIMDEPFIKAFYSQDAEMLRLVRQRRLDIPAGRVKDYTEHPAVWAAQEKAICDHLGRQ